MIRCHTCQTPNLVTSRFCDECGTRLIQVSAYAAPEVADYVPPPIEPPLSSAANFSTAGSPPVAAEPLENISVQEVAQHAHATLVIERGGTPGTEFQLTNDESTIGRWDADNGIFPDIDLDTQKYRGVTLAFDGTTGLTLSKISVRQTALMLIAAEDFCRVIHKF